MEQPYLSYQTAEGPQKVVLGGAPLTIGRSSENLLVIEDLQASRFHCVIARTNKGYIIRDLDSRNGTRVNGELIRTALLSWNDVIAIGTTEFRLVVPSRAPAGAAATDKPAAPSTPPPATSAAGKPRTTPAQAPPQPAAKRERPLPPQPQARAPVGFRDEKPPAEASLDPVDLSDVADLEPAEARAIANEIAMSIEPDGEQALVDFSSPSTKADDERFLPVLAGSLPNQSFEAGDIALINARGGVAHPPASATRKKAGAGEAVSVLRNILLICSRGRATDIHLEPKNDDFHLRLRIDGTMVDIARLTKPMGTRLGALVKVLCEIDLQHRNIIQEGHFTAMVGEHRVDFRVSFAPAMFGQKLGVRILDTDNAPLHMGNLHLPMWMLESLQRAIQRDSGMILVCGPTGSGKTTTLYALLRSVGAERRNVITIEDPVEIQIEGATQIPVNDEQGNSFASLLRSMLRQDPDVMMVGEIRDPETARTAMQAAMTGHLVLSTVHARDTIGAAFRLLDLGVEPYLISSSLQIILSQRLARELCPYCKRGMRPTPDQIQRMGPAGRGVHQVFMPVGCASCLKTGFAGRRAFFEMLTTNDELREVILKSPTPRDIERALSTTRFVRLAQTGYQLVAEGITAFDEIDRTVGRDGPAARPDVQSAKS